MTGGGDNNWFTATNWDTDTVPTNANLALIGAGTDDVVNISSAGAVSGATLIGLNGGNGTVLVDGTGSIGTVLIDGAGSGLTSSNFASMGQI